MAVAAGSPAHGDAPVLVAGDVGHHRRGGSRHVRPYGEFAAAHSVVLPGEGLDPDIVERGRGQVCQLELQPWVLGLDRLDLSEVTRQEVKPAI